MVKQVNKHASENKLVRSIRSRFPKEAVLTDRWLVERGWDPADLDGIAYTWVEAFADRITEAIKRRDVEGVRAQTGFLADQYLAAPESLRTIVDVSYAENIMWDASDEEKHGHGNSFHLKSVGSTRKCGAHLEFSLSP